MNADVRPPHGRAAVAAALALIVVAIAYYIAFGRITFSPKTFGFDLVAFYCGGEVVLERADPYRVEPLRACEHRLVAPVDPRSPLVIPAPQPPYVLLSLAALHGLPYPAAETLVSLLEIAAFLATIRLVHGLLPLSPWLVWSALGLSDFYSSFYLGQLAVFCTLGIVLTGWGLQRRSIAAVVTGLVLAACEPHIALPVFLALLFFGTRAERSATLALGILLLLLSLATLPPDILHEYAYTVLKLHALSEIANQEQLSFAYLLHSLGVSPETAIRIASIQYVAFVAASLAVIVPLSKRYGRIAVAFVPAAFALVGGPFIHVTQMSAAMPAVLMLFARAFERRYACALLLFAIPWLDARALLVVLPFVAACSAVIARYALRMSAAATWTIAFAAFGAVGYAGYITALERASTRGSYGTIHAHDFSEVPWQRVVDLRAHTHVIMADIEKAPTELALAILIIGLLTSVKARPASVRITA